MKNLPYKITENQHLDVEELLFPEENEGKLLYSARAMSGTFQDIKDNIDKLASLYGDDTKVLLEVDYDSTYVILRWEREPTDEELERHIASEKKKDAMREKKRRAIEAKEKKEMQRLMSKYHERV